MRKLFPSFLLFLFLIPLASSCSFEDVQVEEITDFKMLSVEKNELNYELKVRINNPNNTAFTITRADVDLFLSGTEMGRTRLPEKVKIKSNSNEVVTVKLQTELNKPLKEYMGTLLSTVLAGQLNLELQGEVKGRCCLLITKKFDVDHQERVAIKDLAF